MQKHHKEHPEGESLTVPNEAMGIREIMRRFTRGGIMPSGYKQPIYDPQGSLDSEDLEKLNRADFFDRQEAADRFREAAEIAKAKAGEELKAKRESAKQKADKAKALDDLLADKAKEAKGPGASDVKERSE